MLKAEGAAGTYMSCKRSIEPPTEARERRKILGTPLIYLKNFTLAACKGADPNSFMPSLSLHREPSLPGSAQLLVWTRFLGVELVHLSLCSSSDVSS